MTPKVFVILIATVFFIADVTLAQNSLSNNSETKSLMRILLQQDVSTGQILGVDAKGIPLVCGIIDNDTESLSRPQALGVQLPLDTRGFEFIPGVIRNNGLDSFRMEVNTNGPVAKVMIDIVSASLIPPESPPFEFRDDGLEGDRIAGDFVFTSGAFRYNTTFPFPDYYKFDPDSPAGVHTLSVGRVVIDELDGSQTMFLDSPDVGVLSSNIPETNTVNLSADVVTSPHLINIRSNVQHTQNFLRLSRGNLSTLTNSIYQVVPDVFDFFIFFSTNKIERLPRVSSANFIAGIHANVQTNFRGTGIPVFDNSSAYGSKGKLLGINVIDAYSRGISSNNLTHEITHQWAAYIDFPALKEDFAHYHPRSNAASLVGGFQWNDNGDDTFMLDCSQGRNGINKAPPIDKYLMGLIEASEVPPLHAYSQQSPSVGIKCSNDEPIFADEIITTVMVDDIIERHGVRTPSPVDAQRDFSIAFVAESHNRLLNPTEMTFYEILAKHYTKTISPLDPDPVLGNNWAPMTRFFGERTTWRSDISVHKVGDFNGDDCIDRRDLNIIVSAIRGGSRDLSFDLNNDGNTNIADARKLVNLFTNLRGASCRR